MSTAYCFFAVAYIFAVIDNTRFVRKMTENRAEGKYELDPADAATLDFRAQRIYYPVYLRFLKWRALAEHAHLRPACRVLQNALCAAHQGRGGDVARGRGRGRVARAVAEPVRE